MKKIIPQNTSRSFRSNFCFVILNEIRREPTEALCHKTHGYSYLSYA